MYTSNRSINIFQWNVIMEWNRIWNVIVKTPAIVSFYTPYCLERSTDLFWMRAWSLMTTNQTARPPRTLMCSFLSMCREQAGDIDPPEVQSCDLWETKLEW